MGIGVGQDWLPRELRIFQRLASVVAAAPYDVQDVLERIATEFREAFSLDRALVVRYRERERTVHAVVQQAVDWPGDEWLRVDRFPFLTEALETGRPVFVRDARTEDAVPVEYIERFDVRSVVAAPLITSGRSLGFLVGDRAGSPFRLQANDLEVLAALGTVAAVLIEKADQLAELEEALDELRGLDQAKTDFVSIASHELRTPIAAAHGIATTLHVHGRNLRSDQVLELQAALYDQTSRLGSLVDQLLDLSRLDAGAVVVHTMRFRCRERLDTVVGRMTPERAGQIVVGVDPALELETDPLAFERVLSNLLDNAFRYGRPPIEIHVQGVDALRVTVKDSGDGVEPAFVPQLFDRFTRARTSREQQPEGAGLGLAIASSFAEAIGGRLSYEPGVPSGACFTLELPA